VDGELIAAFSRLGRNDLIDATVSRLQQKILAQPEDLQVVYKAQLGLILQGIGRQQNWLEEAEKQAAGLADPVRQSQVYGKIAVSQKVAGQAAYNQNFVLAEDKIKTVLPSFEQFSGYISLAHDYKKIGNATNAEVAMILAELTLAKLPASRQEEGLVKLLDTAYLLNDAVYINKFSTRIRDAVYRCKASYLNIQSQIQEGSSGNLAKPLANINEADFAAVTNALAALLETEPAAQSSLLNLAQQNLLLVADQERKAVSSGKVARYLARLGRNQEAAALFDQALSSAQAVQNSAQRDAVLISLAVDNARVFSIDNASRVAGLIHDERLKAATQNLIKNAQAVRLLAAN